MKARSKSEFKRLEALGAPDLDAHLMWCAWSEFGVCTCDGEKLPAGRADESHAASHPQFSVWGEKPSPASEASGRCEDPDAGHNCCRLANPDPVVAALNHIEALKLLKRAKITLDNALALLGEKA